MKHLAVKFLIGVALLGGCFTGCTTVDRNRADVSSRLVPTLFKPKVEFMNGGQKVSGSAQSLSILWFIPIIVPLDYACYTGEGAELMNRGLGIDLDNVDEAAMESACRAINADIIIGPKFTRYEHGSPFWLWHWKSVTCEGVPAKINGYEKVDDSRITHVRWIDGSGVELAPAKE